MMVPTPLERQVRQNTNDVVAVYELIHGIDRKISALDVAVSTVVGTQLRQGQRPRHAAQSVMPLLEAVDDPGRAFLG
jgi:hypothetical protein